MKKRIARATAVLGAALMIAPIMAFGGAVDLERAGAATPIKVLTCAGKVTEKPSTYCCRAPTRAPDGTPMTWSAWNGSSATGHGILRQNDCTPNCAAGKFINYRATVTLSKVVSTKKHGELFSVATFHYSVSGHAKTEVFDLVD
jgi:hypothetical protein